MNKVNTHEAKTHLSEMLTQIKEHSVSYMICKNGEPVADLIPHQKGDRMTPHPVMSRIALNYDPTEALTGDEWPESS